MLTGKNILIAVTGGIAAYKIPQLIRDLKKSGADVKIVMTDSAKKFVTPLTLATISQHEVVVGNFPEIISNVLHAGTWHIDLAQWANLMLIAPATANTIAKLSHGYADNAVTTMALAMRGPVVLSPSMDVDMWNHSITQSNLSLLRELGYFIIPPEEGELASGLVGKGRLPDFANIRIEIEKIVSFAHQDLKGKKVLVTAGPTFEPIDPVRFIGNRSSGKMGFAVATAAAQRGAEVTLICGRVQLQTPRNVTRVNVLTAAEMYTAVTKQSKNMDAVIMAAAVADFTPVIVRPHKIKKDSENKPNIDIEFKTTKDILKHLGEQKNKSVLVGFAVETENRVKNAKKKLVKKNLDFIVLNDPMQEGAGFDADTNIVTIISGKGKIEHLKKMSKFDVATEILNRISNLL